MERDGFSEKADADVRHVDEQNDAYRERAAKKAQILGACERWDLEQVQLLAQSHGGLLTDELRQQAWPILLGLPPALSISSKEGPTSQQQQAEEEEEEDTAWTALPPHKDEEQVQLDVARAFVYYPRNTSEQDLDLKKTALSNLILSVLRRYPFLHYFQGYHDIAQVFLLVLPPRLRAPAVARLSLFRIRDFMLPNFNVAIAQLRLLPCILRAADPRLWHHLSQTEPFFALSGTLTMYAHDVTSLGEITRLFDVLLAREPVFSVYLFASIVMSRRAELFDTPATEPEMLHSILSKLPKPLDLEAIIARTAALFDEFPPEVLGRAWDKGIGEHSVLKTVHAAPLVVESEAVGEYHFQQQVLELARQERKERMLKMLYEYRKPAGTVGLAVLFGVLAYWMRKSAAPSSTTTAFLAPIAALLSKWWPLEF